MGDFFLYNAELFNEGVLVFFPSSLSGMAKKGQIITWKLRWQKGKEEMSQRQNSVKATN